MAHQNDPVHGDHPVNDMIFHTEDPGANNWSELRAMYNRIEAAGLKVELDALMLESRRTGQHSERSIARYEAATGKKFTAETSSSELAPYWSRK